MKKDFTEEEMRELWSNGKPVLFAGRKYQVNKMSYGDYFFQPYEERNRGETKGFTGREIWAEKKIVNHRVLYEVKKNKLRKLS